MLLPAESTQDHEQRNESPESQTAPAVVLLQPILFLALQAAIAVWIVPAVYSRDSFEYHSVVTYAICLSIVLTIGIASHLAYLYLLRSRWTALPASVLAMLALAVSWRLFMVLYDESPFEVDVFLVLLQGPIGKLSYLRGGEYWLPILIPIGLWTMGAAFRPSFPSAFITATGTFVWALLGYVAGLGA